MMKHLLLILLGACGLGGARAEIIFRAEPPPLPAKTSIVPLARWPMSYATFHRRALELGVRGEALRSPRGLAARSGSLIFQQDTMGGEAFADTDRLMAAEPGAVQPLSDERAISVAQRYLREHPGRVNVDETRVLRVSHLFNQSENLDSGRRSNATQDESIVILQRSLGGVPVIPAEGSGDHIRIHVANNGDVVGRRQMWRNVRAAESPLPVRPYAEARGELVALLSQQMGANQRQDAIITRVEFGLYSRPEGEPQGYLQPAYLFRVELRDREEQQTTGARLIALPGVDPAALKEPLDLPPAPSDTGDPAKIVFRVEPPQLLGYLPVIQIRPIAVTGVSIRQRASQLGLSQGRIRETPRGLGFSDDRLLLYQNPQGTELFSDMSRMMAEAPGEGTPISDQRAISLATDYLNGLGDMDADELGVPVVRRLRQQTFDTKANKPGPETQDEAIVEFPRIHRIIRLVSVPFIGPGAFARVHIDNAGKITGHHRVWRALSPESTMLKTRNTAAIQDEFKRQILSEMGQSIAMVTGIQVGLYMRAEGLDQGYAQPAMLYDVDLMDETTGMVTAHRQIPVPATDNLMEPLEDPDAQPGVTDPALQSTREADNIPLLFGDINDNGVLDLPDVLLCLRIVGGLSQPDTMRQMVAGDVTPAGNPLGDGRIILTDAARILRGFMQLDDLNAS